MGGFPGSCAIWPTAGLRERRAATVRIAGERLVPQTSGAGLRPLGLAPVGAARGRVEPISALYALGQISHVGTFPELEDQMCCMTAAGYEGESSPDRLDALVWGLTQLFPGMTKWRAKAGGRSERAESDYSPHRW